jgi:hypothetical protein
MYGHIDTQIKRLSACEAVTLSGHISGGPHFDELHVGQVFGWAPSMTLSAGPR